MSAAPAAAESNVPAPNHPLSLPASLQLHLILGLAAPADLWQDGATAHPDIRPVQVPTAAAFDRLVRSTRKVAGGRLPPASRLSADLVLPQARC